MSHVSSSAERLRAVFVIAFARKPKKRAEPFAIAFFLLSKIASKSIFRTGRRRFDPLVVIITHKHRSDTGRGKHHGVVLDGVVSWVRRGSRGMSGRRSFRVRSGMIK